MSMWLEVPANADDLPVTSMVRRDYVNDQARTAALLTTAPSGACPPSPSCRSVFRSVSPQRPPPCEPIPKVMSVQSVPVSYGGRVLGPYTYDMSQPWITDPDRKNGTFTSTSPRLRKTAVPLSAEHDFVVSDTRQQSASAPFSRGKRWNKSARYPSPSRRDHGLDETMDPEAGSLAAAVKDQSRSYKALFESGTNRFPQAQSTNLGPGRYDPPVRAMSVARSNTVSRMFQSPTNNKASKRPYHLSELLNTREPFGGQWVRAGNIDRHWTNRSAKWQPN